MYTNKYLLKKLSFDKSQWKNKNKFKKNTRN